MRLLIATLLLVSYIAEASAQRINCTTTRMGNTTYTTCR